MFSGGFPDGDEEKKSLLLGFSMLSVYMRPARLWSINAGWGKGQIFVRLFCFL